MNTYLATEFRVDGHYGVRFEAASWEDAEAFCEARGIRLDGLLTSEHTD